MKNAPLDVFFWVSDILNLELHIEQHKTYFNDNWFIAYIRLKEPVRPTQIKFAHSFGAPSAHEVFDLVWTFIAKERNLESGVTAEQIIQDEMTLHALARL